MDREAFEAYLAKTSPRVDEEMAAYLEGMGDLPNLHDGVRYALGLDRPERRARGKRLRPVLCLLTCESLGGDPEAALPFALACEMMHNFFLVHDDIEDRDAMRRGRESVWVRFGLDHGVNIGDYMFAQTYDLAQLSGARGVDREVVGRLVALVTETVKGTGEGQTLEMNARGRRDLTPKDYLAIVTAKTGLYLAAPLVGGALVAGGPEEVVQTLRALGDRIGPIFQIADDVIDLTEGKGRGEVGSDIKEGKRSLLVVRAAQACTSEEREELYRILDAPREGVTAKEVAWVVDLFARTGAVEAAREEGRRMLEEAQQLVDALPEPLDANLRAAMEFMLARTW